MRILATGTAHPKHYYTQQQLHTEIRRVWMQQHHNPKRVDQIFQAVNVKGRYLSLSVEEFKQTKTFGENNNIYIKTGLEVSKQAINQALKAAQLSAADVDAIFFVSTSGLAIPTLDARLVNELGLRADIKRYPLFGYGCVGGAAGTARLFDYLQGHPDGVALLVCLELSSLNLQKEDFSIGNLISSGLFGDGCAALLAVGAAHPALQKPAHKNSPNVIATGRKFYPETLDAMCWEITENGLEAQLSVVVPKLVDQHLRHVVDEFLNQHQLHISDITTWVCHTGGPKVLEAIQRQLDITQDAVQLTWDSLEQVGNLSSASVLFVLDATIKTRTPSAPSYGLMLAFGPGFTIELLLLKW